MDLLELVGILIPGMIAAVFLGRGWIRTINTAYRESTLQGRLCLFPLYAIYYSIRKDWFDVKSVITGFMKAGVARNVEAAYACWSPQCTTEEEIAELIESSYDVFAGYERLSINSLGQRSHASILDVADVAEVTEGDVGGAIIYTAHRRLPLKARLVKENDVWKIISMQIGSTKMMDIVRRLSISLGGPPGPGS